VVRWLRRCIESESAKRRHGLNRYEVVGLYVCMWARLPLLSIWERFGWLPFGGGDTESRHSFCYALGLLI